MLRAVAGTHWSEDTLGLPPENLARCVLPPRSSKAVSRVNFPLSSYSVFCEKNVSQEKYKKCFRPENRRFCPGEGTVDSSRQSPELREQALESLPDRVRR